MGLFTREKKATATEQKQPEKRTSLLNFDWWNQFAPTTQSNISVTYHNTIGIAAYKRGVELRSASIAAMSINLYRYEGEQKVKVTDSPAITVIRKPNAYQTEYQFRQWMISQAVGRGNGYAWIKRDANYNPIVLKPVQNPDSVTITETSAGEVFYTIGEIGFPNAPIPATDILHFKSLAWQSPYKGLSPIQAHRERFGIIMAADKSAATTYKTGTKKFLIKSDQNISTLQQVNLKESIENVVNDSAVSAVMPAGASVETISLSIADAQYIENANLGVQEVGRILGIPNSFLNIDAGGKTTEDEWQGFLTNTLLPDSVNYEQELSNKLLKENQIGTYFFKHSFNSIMRANSAARADYFTKAISAGWLSPNEVAALEDMPLSPDGNNRYILAGLVPLNQMEDWMASKITANENKIINNPNGENNGEQ